jgi:hypothetical protein
LAATALANSLNTSYTFVPVFAEVNMNLTFFSFAQDLIFYYGIELPRSDLLPTRNNTEFYAFALQRSYHDFVAF